MKNDNSENKVGSIKNGNLKAHKNRNLKCRKFGKLKNWKWEN